MDKTFKQWIALILAIVIVLILQQVFVLELFQIFSYVNIILIFLLFILLYQGFAESMLLGVILGLFLDVFSSTIDGTMTLAIIVTLALSQIVVDVLLPKELLKTAFILVLLDSVLFPFVIFLITLITNFFVPADFDLSGFFTLKFLIALLVNSLLVYPVFIYYKLMARWAYN